MLLGLLGFAGCGDINSHMAEYGTPTGYFSVKGNVQDEAGNPIPNIKAGMGNHPGDVYHSQVTDENGVFVFDKHRSWPDEKQWLSFRDDDGEANGGEFETAEIEVVFTKTGGGNGNWVQGYYEAPDIAVTLVRKAEAPQEQE